MMCKEQTLAALCEAVGMSYKILTPGEYDSWKGVKVMVSGRCDNGNDEFSFVSLPSIGPEEACGRALTYFVSPPSGQADPAKRKSVFPFAKSVEELELKLAARG